MTYKAIIRNILQWHCSQASPPKVVKGEFIVRTELVELYTDFCKAAQGENALAAKPQIPYLPSTCCMHMLHNPGNSSSAQAPHHTNIAWSSISNYKACRTIGDIGRSALRKRCFNFISTAMIEMHEMFSDSTRMLEAGSRNLHTYGMPA